MTRIALVGLGHIGRIHVAALSQTEGLELAAGCDHDPSLATVLPEGTPFYSALNELFAAGGFDAVVVATPNQTHNAIAMEALAAGYHVIVEKPAASSLEELDALGRLATEQGRHVYYAFHAASAFEVDALVTQLGEQYGRSGPITAFTSRFYDPYIDAQGRLVPHVQSLDDCWSDSGVNALSVLDRLLPLEKLRPTFRRQSGEQGSPLGVLSASVGFHFPVLGQDGAGFGLIDTAWDQGLNYKATTLYFGHSGWRIEANHSEQTVTLWDPHGQATLLCQFQGDRLLNHYLGLFADYSLRVNTNLSMNADAAHRVHAKLFEGMKRE